jgi:hypothetical protein
MHGLAWLRHRSRLCNDPRLTELGDHLLHDIGLSRYEARCVEGLLADDLGALRTACRYGMP